MYIFSVAYTVHVYTSDLPTPWSCEIIYVTNLEVFKPGGFQT